MKILHITPDLNFAINFVKPLCIEQQKLNNDVLVISTKAYYSLPDGDSNLENSKKIKFKMLNLRLRNFRFDLIKAYSEYIRMLRSEKFDIIIFHTTLDTTVPLIIAKLFSNSTNIYFNHGVPSLGYNGFVKVLLNLVEKTNMSLADTVFTVGPAMSMALNQINSKVVAQYINPGSACGINLITKHFNELLKLRESARIELKYSPSAKVALYVGRPVRRKGIFDVIEAWRSLELDKDHILLLVGPKQVDLKGVDIDNLNIEIIGYLPDVTKYYLCSDILCLPSYHEGLGYTYLEAASAGCVPICSDIPGPTDFVINGESGLTVNPGSIQEISGSIKKLFDNKPFRLKLAEAAFESVQNYDRKKLALELAGKIQKCKI